MSTNTKILIADVTFYSARDKLFLFELSMYTEDVI